MCETFFSGSLRKGPSILTKVPATRFYSDANDSNRKNDATTTRGKLIDCVTQSPTSPAAFITSINPKVAQLVLKKYSQNLVAATACRSHGSSSRKLFEAFPEMTRVFGYLLGDASA